MQVLMQAVKCQNVKMSKCKNVILAEYPLYAYIRTKLGQNWLGQNWDKIGTKSRTKLGVIIINLLWDKNEQGKSLYTPKRIDK